MAQPGPEAIWRRKPWPFQAKVLPWAPPLLGASCPGRLCTIGNARAACSRTSTRVGSRSAGSASEAPSRTGAQGAGRRRHPPRSRPPRAGEDAPAHGWRGSGLEDVDEKRRGPSFQPPGTLHQYFKVKCPAHVEETGLPRAPGLPQHAPGPAHPTGTECVEGRVSARVSSPQAAPPQPPARPPDASLQGALKQPNAPEMQRCPPAPVLPGLAARHPVTHPQGPQCIFLNKDRSL